MQRLDNRPERTPRTVQLLLTFALVVGLGSGCGRSQGTPSEPAEDLGVGAPLLEASPETVGASPEAGYLGVLVARESIHVAGEVEARLHSVEVRVGDEVTRGDVIARLDTTELEQELQMAEASYRAAAADRQQAEVELGTKRERLSRRHAADGLFSSEELASASADQQMAAAQLQSATARWEQERVRSIQLRERLQRSNLRAPIDGKVAERYLDPGAVMSPGTAVLRLISSQDYLIRFAVPADEIDRIALEMDIELHIEHPRMSLPGTISQIAPRIDSASQMVFVEAQLAAENRPPSAIPLQDGMNGRVRLGDPQATASVARALD